MTRSVEFSVTSWVSYNQMLRCGLDAKSVLGINTCEEKGDETRLDKDIGQEKYRQ